MLGKAMVPGLPRILFSKGWIRPLSDALAGMAAVLLLNLVAFHLHLNFTSVGYADLLAIVFIALRSGFVTASAASLLSIACLNYFFIPPIFSFMVADPQNWVALATFETTALVVSRLSLRLRLQADSARNRSLDVERLYQMSRRILLLDLRREAAGHQVAQSIQQTFQLESVLLFDAAAAAFFQAGTAPAGLDVGVRRAFLQNVDSFDQQTNTWFLVVRLGAEPEGALALRGAGLSGVVAPAIASLTAVALSHTRAFERESRAQASSESEQLRSAVLDALAHEFKTPLTTIRTASSGLLEMKRLTHPQRELIGLIDTETEKLSRITTSLLQTAELQAAEVRVQKRSIRVPDLVSHALASSGTRLGYRNVSVSYESDLAPVSVDLELCTAALVQLIDNACKYSSPGSEIAVEVKTSAGNTVIAVRNDGVPIPAEEQERIFDRYYRSPEMSVHAGGTGVGLSAARQLIQAQDGHIWVYSEEGAGTTFYVSLPAAGAL